MARNIVECQIEEMSDNVDLPIGNSFLSKDIITNGQTNWFQYAQDETSPVATSDGGTRYT